MKPERIDEIRARAEAATPGPWVANAETRGNTIAVVLSDRPRDQYYIDPWPPGNCARHPLDDAKLIATMRQDIPALLDALEEARNGNERLQGMCQRLAHNAGQLRRALIKAANAAILEE